MTVKIELTCPQCGNSTWFEVPEEAGFECAACGEFCYPEDMGSATKEVTE